MTSPAIAPLSAPPHASIRREIWALILRHVYLHLGSWPRLVEVLYWPIINISLYGFISLYVVRTYGHATVMGDVLVAGVLLTEVFIRVCITFLMLFLEEIWSRNLGHLFASPLRLREYVAGLAACCSLRVVIALTPATLVAYWFFGFAPMQMGWPLLAYVILLVVNGFWYGLLIVAFLFRYGLAAEWLSWMATWLLVPLMASYYPVSVLPWWLQVISNLIPATHVFESMKSLLATGDAQTAELWKALALNAAYLPLAALVLKRAYDSARARGGLLQTGE